MPETRNQPIRTSANIARKMIEGAVSKLASAGIASPRLDAEAMLAVATDSSRAAVICGSAAIDGRVSERVAAMIARRVQGEPLAYILGCKEFYSIELEVTPAVLIPRPETEALVDAALEFVKRRDEMRICDLGAGSGAIGLAIAANAPAAQVTAIDVSPGALAIASRNAARLGLAARFEFRLADCFEPTDGMERLGRFDLIVSNPPYIEEDQIGRLPREISHYEPRLALAGGKDGLELYRRIASTISSHLEKGARVILEIGAGQLDHVYEIMRKAGAGKMQSRRDLAGVLRVVIADFQ